jgi:hypothetical protein
VFSKAPDVSPDPTPRQAAILAAAVRRLPETWAPDDSAATEARVIGLLGLPSDGPWSAEALRDVYNCRPPLTELSAKNHGLLFLRWRLQRIMPYPCFLHDSYRLAARLRVSHESLLGALNGKLGRWLDPVRYTGVAAGFLGNRWWRAGVEDIVWGLTDGAGVPGSVLRSKLSEVAGAEMKPSASEAPVVGVNENYQPLPEACPSDAVIRIQPDDWPVFASQAWTTVELARQHARLRAVVVGEDLEKLVPADAADPGAGAGRE